MRRTTINYPHKTSFFTSSVLRVCASSVNDSNRSYRNHIRRLVLIASQFFGNTLATQLKALAMRGSALSVILWCCSTASFAADIHVLGTDGAWRKGPALADATTLTINNNKLPLTQVIMARHATSAIAQVVDSGVVLTNGDIIAGGGLVFQNGQVTISSDRFGLRTFPAAAIAALMLAPQRTVKLLRITDTSAGAIFANGDALSGNLAFLNAASAGIDTGRRIMDMPRARISLLRLATTAVPPVAQHHVRLVSGELISGIMTSLNNESLLLTHALIGDVQLPLSMISHWRYSGDSIIPINRLTLTTKQSGFLDAGIAPSMDKTWRNEPLMIDGQVAEFGLGTRARCNISFDVMNPATSFIATVALDASYGLRGDAMVRVLGDDKPLFEIALTDHKSHTIVVPLHGARRITLVTDAGADGTTIDDEVIWAWPVVVRQ